MTLQNMNVLTNLMTSETLRADYFSAVLTSINMSDGLEYQMRLHVGYSQH